MFERLRDALDAFLDSATPGDPHDATARMHDAVVETRAALHGLHDGLKETEQKLARQRQQLADAERRGQLARGIDDTETAEIADRYAAKHRERVEVYEQKSVAQRHEIELAEREFEEMKQQLRTARERRGGSNERLDQAWRSIESAGGSRPDSGGDSLADDLLRSEVDRAAREVAAEDKLRQLKKKMGR